MCVDCGTLAHAPLAAAAQLGLDVIVVDHHAAEPALPTALAIVNPNRLDDESGLGTLCAAGVVFLLLVSLNRALRQRGRFANSAEPILLDLLDLVALATVCDVMPLAGLNRALVAQGLKVMARRGRAGLAALADSAQVAARLDSRALGFTLGPRINAGGRVGRSDLGARLLATDDPNEARMIAAELEALNAERRQIEAEQVAAAIVAIEAVLDPATPIIVAHGEGWHPGVIGIVAARLRERYDRPSCVIAWDGEIGKGSGRSVPGVDLGAAVIAARQAGILVGGGGHAMAAGFTIERRQLAAFERFMAGRLDRGRSALPAVRRLMLDGVVQPSACVPDLIRSLEALEPFGTGNPEPHFALPQARIVSADIVGQNGHVRCRDPHRRLVLPAQVNRLSCHGRRHRSDEALLQSAGIGGIHASAGQPAYSTRWQGRNDVQLHHRRRGLRARLYPSMLRQNRLPEPIGARLYLHASSKTRRPHRLEA